MNNFKRTILAICIIIAFAAIAIGAFYLLQQDPITKTVEITLEVKAAPDFTLTASIDHIITPIDRTISFALTVVSIDFAGDITFSVADYPPGSTVTMFPSDTLTLGEGETRGINVEIVIPDDPTIIGNYTITAMAQSTVYN